MVVVEAGGELVDVLLGNVMRCQDHAVVVGKPVDAGEEESLVGRPGAAGNDAVASVKESLHLGESARLSRDSGDTVETGVTADRGVMQPDAFEELASDFVLDEEMGHQPKLLAEPSSVPAEEILPRPEQQRDII